MEDDEMTQNTKILALLRERGERGLTPLEALNEVGSFRLASRIWDVKNMLNGDEEIITTTANHDGTTFARYILRKRDNEGQVTLW